jgi:hypothetical protein
LVIFETGSYPIYASHVAGVTGAHQHAQLLLAEMESH